MTISVSSQTSLLNIANNFVFALYDASADTIVLESKAPAKPYGNPLQITFLYNALAGHVYIIKLWESSNTTPTGAERNSFNLSANGQSVTIRMDEYWEADVFPSSFASGVNSVTDTSLLNWQYSVERVSQGTMTPDNTGTSVGANYHQISTGGFSLLQSGDIFQPNEKFVLRFAPQIAIAAPAGTPSPIFSTGQILTADKTLINTDLAQALILQGAGASVSITLPALNTVLDGSFCYLYSNGGNHVSAPILAVGTDKISFGGDQSKIIINQGEVLKLYKLFGKWQVDYVSPGVMQVGELVFKPAKNELNLLLCDGRELSRVTYARLWAWIQTLDAGCLVTKSVWTSTTQTIDGVAYYTKKGKFHTGDGSTTFGIPLLFGQFIRPVNGTDKIAGDWFIDTMLDHGHTVKGRSGSSSAPPGGINFPNGGDRDVPTSSVTKTDGSTLQRKGTETAPIHTGEYLNMRY